MRLIDADELRAAIDAARREGVGVRETDANGRDDTPWRSGWCSGQRHAIELLDAAPTVDVPQPWTRDGALAEVARIEAAGDTAVVEVLHTFTGKWQELSLAVVRDWWLKPDEPRGNVRVRAVEVETETVPLTQLVGRTIKGCERCVHTNPRYWGDWQWNDGLRWVNFPDGTLDLATGLVTVVKGEA